ncbi:MAG: hypothetical protein IT363_00190 [Methanoregulaceae archaeon]|nr:hypothetical protein [Methanoregulaceae archaeon]
MKKIFTRLSLLTVLTAGAVAGFAQSIVGTYAGYSQAMEADVYARFSDGGRVELRIASRRTRDIRYQRGTYDEGNKRISAEGTIYMVTKVGDKLQLREAKNSTNTFELVPRNLGNIDWGSGWDTGGWGSGGTGGGAIIQRPPSWLVGEFDGYNRKMDADINLKVNSVGVVTASIRYANGRRVTELGAYRNGQFSIGKTWYQASQIENGLRAQQTNDRNNWMEFRRHGSGTGSGSGWNGVGTQPPDVPPTWAQGRFEGYSQRYRADLELTIDNRGYLKALFVYRDGRRETKNGWYRGGKIVIGGVTYKTTKTNDGFRLVAQDSPLDTTTYCRVR